MASRHRRVVWSQEARRELDEAVEHIAGQAPTAAAHFVERLLETAASLSTLGKRGRVVPERSDPSIRELLVDPYRLVYLVGSDQVVILGLIHQRRSFEGWRDPDS